MWKLRYPDRDSFVRAMPQPSCVRYIENRRRLISSLLEKESKRNYYLLLDNLCTYSDACILHYWSTCPGIIIIATLWPWSFWVPAITAFYRSFPGRRLIHILEPRAQLSRIPRLCDRTRIWCWKCRLHRCMTTSPSTR